jgi:hypothetical protein
LTELALSGCPVVGVLEEGHIIRLRAFLPFNDVELDFIAFSKRFVTALAGDAFEGDWRFNCGTWGVVEKPMITVSDETVLPGAHA